MRHRQVEVVAEPGAAPTLVLTDKYASHVLETILCMVHDGLGAAGALEWEEGEACLGALLVGFCDKLLADGVGGLRAAMQDRHGTYVLRSLLRHDPDVIIEYGLEHEFLIRVAHPLGDVVTTDPKTALQMAYVRNNSLHLFVLPGLVFAATRSTALTWQPLTRWTCGG